MTLALADAAAPSGSPTPRIAPPIPARSDVAGFRETATWLDIDLMPWQETAARYLEAQDADGRHLYREIAVIMARQNGKTTLLKPLIVKRLLAGARIMHTAQDRSLPREVFYAVAEFMWEHHAKLFPKRNDRDTKPRYANGQEEVRLTNGGIYSIVAPTRGGARGPSRDLVIIDELREMDTWDFIAAAKPTMTAAPDPQMLYLSNAGEPDSVVLNAIRDRADTDPVLAYLEWSASPDRLPDDLLGWCESNPALGHEREGMGSILTTLETEYRTAKLEGTMARFETEHLCRWVDSMRRPLLTESAWANCVDGALGEPVKPFVGIALDPAGAKAAAAAAWRQPDGTIGLRLLFDVSGTPINTDRLGADMREAVRKLDGQLVGFDPLTDAVLAKHFRHSEPIAGNKHANASARFVASVESGTLHWHDAQAVGMDLTWTARKPHPETGSFQAVRAADDRPITAALAAIRAVWLASEPTAARKPRVYAGSGW